MSPVLSDHSTESYSELTALLDPLYDLLPLPAASSALVEALSESLFKFGKGTKVLTEPLIAWITGPAGQSLLESTHGGRSLFACNDSADQIERPLRRDRWPR